MACSYVEGNTGMDQNELEDLVAVALQEDELKRAVMTTLAELKKAADAWLTLDELPADVVKRAVVRHEQNPRRRLRRVQ